MFYYVGGKVTNGVEGIMDEFPCIIIFFGHSNGFIKPHNVCVVKVIFFSLY